MSDIFLSYASEDKSSAQALAQALEKQGWSVWWDRRIPAGRTYDEIIEKALEAAKCVIVLWSSISITSRWVRSEAEEGADRGILVPALIEDVRIPLAFRRIQAANLSAWKEDHTDPVFLQLVDDVTALLGTSQISRRKPQQTPHRFNPHTRSKYTVRIYNDPTPKARELTEHIRQTVSQAGYKVAVSESEGISLGSNFSLSFQESQKEFAQDIASLLTTVRLNRKKLKLEAANYITKDYFDIWIWSS